MPVYQYEGQHFDLPDGLSNEQAIAKIETYLGKSSTPSPAPATTAPQPTIEQGSTLEKMIGLGSPTGRFIKGAIIDPALAVNQMIANTGILGQGVKEAANKNIEQLNAATAASQKRTGNEGLDITGTLGAILSPANKIAGAAEAVPLLARSIGTGAMLGALQPTTGEDYATSKTLQMGVGGALGPLTELGVNALGKVTDVVKGLTPTGRTEALRAYMEKLTSPAREEIMSALRKAEEVVTGSKPTAAEAVANIPAAAELAAVQRKLQGQEGIVGKFKTREAEQQAARQGVLQGIAGTPEQRAALEAERKVVTDASRETALQQADVAAPIVAKLESDINQKYASRVNALQQAGKAETVAAQQENLANNFTPVPGYPQFPGRYTNMAERVPEYQQTASVFKDIAAQRQKELDLKKFQLQSLSDNGFFPLKATDITDRIDAAIKGTVSDESKAVLQGVKAKILSKADENGVLSSRDLYENVRKTLNQDIAVYLGQGERYAQGGIPQQAAKTGENVKKYIDAALDKSSDGLWSKYLTDYSTYSKRLDRMSVGDALSQKLGAPLENKERAAAFATAVQDAGNLIKRSTGIPRYSEIGQVLTKEETGAVNKVLADLQRKAKAEELSKGVTNLSEANPNAVSELPNLLSRPVAIARSIMDHLHKGNKVEFDKKVADLLLNPQQMAQFIDTVAPAATSKAGKEQELVSAMLKAMDPATKAAFIQALTVAPMANQAGQ